MSTLLIRLKGPQQSWGVQSRYSERDTLREPSKSGVVGLLAAALGRPRSADLSDLAALTMGIRVEREGQLMRDFHTAGAFDTHRNTGGHRKASGKWEKKNVILSNRYFLADAWFTVGLEGYRPLLETIDKALQNAHWPLALGRRAFPPSAPVHIEEGLSDLSLIDALLRFEDPYYERILHREMRDPARLVLEEQQPLPGWALVAAPMRHDQPTASRPRHFLPRTVYVYVKQEESTTLNQEPA